MQGDYPFTVVEKFLHYVQIDTQSDPQSGLHPSTAKQKKLAEVLTKELLSMGIKDAHTDQFGYVYATIPSNTSRKVPVICFCSHIDTAPDCSGTHVKPILHENYTGEAITLPDDPAQVIRIEDYPYLKKHIGHSIITASGLTLLGGDDKSGVAIIMDMVNYLTTHPETKHGDIKILFTPDEEIGEGTAELDLQKLGADFAYTLDGGEAGSFEDETFSADSVTLTLQGVMAHPGYARGKMVNALKIAGEILSLLPKESWCPEATDNREGFVHPVRIEGNAETAVIEWIIRDFESANLALFEDRLQKLAGTVVAKYPPATMHFTVAEQYRNMKEILDRFPQVSSCAEEAYRRSGLKVTKEPIRGGTDGSRLSFMGLPCPNIFTGMQAIHSKHEWIGVKDMQKSVEVLVNLVQVWAESGA